MLSRSAGDTWFRSFVFAGGFLCALRFFWLITRERDLEFNSVQRVIERFTAA